MPSAFTDTKANVVEIAQPVLEVLAELPFFLRQGGAIVRWRREVGWRYIVGDVVRRLKEVVYVERRVPRARNLKRAAEMAIIA